MDDAPKPGNNISRRGFASMSPERVRELASKGGRNAQRKGTAHRWTPESAKRANQEAIASRRRRRETETETENESGS